MSLTIRHAKKRRKPAPKLIRVFFITINVLLLTVASLGLYALNHLTSSVNQVDLGDPVSSIPNIGPYSGEINLLLLGSDTRNGQSKTFGANPGSSLNDVNILLHINSSHTTATAISFPRDLYVDSPSCKKTGSSSYLPAQYNVKINSLLSSGGIGCIRDTVEKLTGLTIPYAGLITFDGVVNVTNAIGGVQVCVAKAIHDEYTGLDLSKGTHTLKGVQALQFLRTRHGVGDGSDLTRISSQQVYLSALVRKLKTEATFSNIPALYGLSTAIVKNVTLSTTLNNTDTLVSMASALAPIGTDNIVFVQYPTTLKGDGVVTNTSSANKLLNAIKADKKLKVQSGNTSGDKSLPGSVTTDKPSATASPTPTPTSTSDSGTVTLPDDVYGQPASANTCSVGNDLGSR
jgi:LCP family protein required for cell wall assembly